VGKVSGVQVCVRVQGPRLACKIAKDAERRLADDRMRHKSHNHLVVVALATAEGERHDEESVYMCGEDDSEPEDEEHPAQRRLS